MATKPTPNSSAALIDLPAVERKVPRNAFTFEAPVSGLVDSKPAEKGDDAEGPPPPAPISILARSAQPLDHWYWGRIVHDMAGMKVVGERIQLDWIHNCEENLGFLDKFVADPAVGLSVSGQLVPFDREDRASQVLHKGRAGVPYQASIDWNGPGCLIEEVGEGVTVEVNGYQFAGPGVVVRQWPLTSVALCPYGYDPDTRAQFADRDDRRDELAVRFFSKGPQPMSSTTTTTASNGDARKEFATELRKFTDRFGAANGAKWFAEGLPFVDALEQHATAQAATITERDATIVERDKKIEELTQKLSGLKLGEISGVSSGDAEADANKGKKNFSSVVRMKK
jgi:uncharacterized coiled-coil protein SlyX